MQRWSNLLIICIMIFYSCGVDYQMRKAERYEKDNRLQEAILIYEKISNKYKNTPYAVLSLMKAGKLEEELSNYSLAIKYYSKIVNEYSSDTLAPYALENIAWIQKVIFENFTTAKETYKRLLNYYPEFAKNRKAEDQIRRLDSLITLLNKGREAYGKKHISESLKFFSLASQLAPTSKTVLDEYNRAFQSETIQVVKTIRYECKRCGSIVKSEKKILQVPRRDSVSNALEIYTTLTCLNCKKIELQNKIIECAYTIRMIKYELSTNPAAWLNPSTYADKLINYMYELNMLMSEYISTFGPLDFYFFVERAGISDVLR